MQMIIKTLGGETNTRPPVGSAMASTTPDRSEIIEMVAKQMYSGRILNNAHRGDLVEMMVLAALGPEWRHVGLGWHPWDLQRGNGPDRIRIQVKQTAAVQLWGDTVSRVLQFGWRPNPPSYFERDNPDEEIETEGWFCEMFVFGIHDEMDRSLIDQADPAQWEFIVIPVGDLKPRTQTMQLSKASSLWRTVAWEQLKQEVASKVHPR